VYFLVTLVTPADRVPGPCLSGCHQTVTNLSPACHLDKLEGATVIPACRPATRYRRPRHIPPVNLGFAAAGEPPSWRRITLDPGGGREQVGGA
jgi:hypothetical protein